MVLERTIKNSHVNKVITMLVLNHMKLITFGAEIESAYYETKRNSKKVHKEKHEPKTITITLIYKIK